MSSEPTDPDAAASLSVEAVVAAQIAGLSARVDALSSRENDHFFHTRDMLARIFDREQDDRRRLAELRASADYETAFTDAAPLVSVVIPTLDRIDSLVNRSLPSVLAQTHPAIEVIVVGDHAEPDMGEAIAAVGDPRVRYHNLTMRGPYPDEPLRAWMASGTPGFNAGIRLARGQWIYLWFDDDEMRPDAIATLLARAQADRLEWVYGKVLMERPDQAPSELGSFPPRVSPEGLESPLQSSLFHAGLFFMELELAHSLFDMSNDVGFTRRLGLAGVRVGFVDEVVASFIPSMRNMQVTGHDPVAVAASEAEIGLRAERDELLHERHWVLQERHQMVIERERLLADLDASRLREAGLTRDLALVLGSRRWRWTEALRRAALRTRSLDGSRR